MDTKYICGKCGGRLVCITEKGTEMARAYGRDEVARVYCQYCDVIPDAQTIEESEDK